MKLFDEVIVWKANKLDTVTILSIKTALLTISQIAKKAFHLFYLMKALILFLPKVLSIKCNNKQTIWLLVNKFTKLQIKLCYIDIYSHWLRQKIQCQSIKIHWVLIKEIMANGLIKTLTVIKYEHFVKILEIKNKKELLASIKGKDNLKDAFQHCRANISKLFGFEIVVSWYI